MSIARMVALGIERQQQAKTGTRAAPGETDTTKKTIESAMEKISVFIPAEVIGIYVAGFGILSPETDTGKWWIFGVSLALIPLFMGLNYLGQRKHSDAKLSLWISFVLLMFAMVAFVAWAAALPGTPFLSFTPRATAIGGWAVVILAILMYRAADLLDVVPKNQ